MPIVSPSLLSADFGHLAQDIEMLNHSEADWYHLDVMDGIFVPNISFGGCVISSLRKKSRMLFDVHLMITNPARYIDDFVKAGADIITIHYESCDDQISVLRQIREAGVKASVSIKPATPAFVLEPLLDYVDMILVMTVEPGFGGQAFIPDTLESVRAASEMVKARGLDIDIEVDGGINPSNIRDAYDAGARVFVAGSSVFKAPDAAEAISALRNAVN